MYDVYAKVDVVFIFFYFLQPKVMVYIVHVTIVIIPRCPLIFYLYLSFNKKIFIKWTLQIRKHGFQVKINYYDNVNELNKTIVFKVSNYPVHRIPPLAAVLTHFFKGMNVALLSSVKKNSAFFLSHYLFSISNLFF